MRAWKIGAIMALAALLAGCGGNSTPVGVTVIPTGTATSPIPVLISSQPGQPSGQQQFTSTVTGTSTSTVNWLICLPPPSLTVTNPIPLNCGQLTGFGTISNTGLYVAPPTPPTPNIFVVAAQSTVNLNIYGLSFVEVDSGVRISIAPTSATIAPGEFFQFTSTVSGTSNTAVTWSVTADSMTVVGGNPTIGVICPSSNDPQNLCNNKPAGTYFAPLTSPGAVTITATSAADSSQSATASVTIGASGNPTLNTVAPIVPAAAQEGSVQQDIYLNGTNFLSTDTVLVSGVPVPTIFLSATLLRATIPASLLVSSAPCSPQTVAPQIPVIVESQNGLNATQQALLTINPSRPALVASSPDSTVASVANVGVALTGGYFSPCTSVFFNAQPVGHSSAGSTSTRVLQVTIPPLDLGAPAVPGLYPIVVQNMDVVAPNPPISAVNLSIEPTSFPSAAPTPGISVGASPSAIAIDPVLDVAVVTNTGAGTVSIINLATNPPTVVPVAVGPNPTGVAIDDQLAHHLAVVVNNGSGNGGNSVTAIDLTTNTVISTLPFQNTAVPPNTVALPFSIGINSSTHRALVTQQSTNVATVLDLSTGTPVFVQQVGGGLSSYSTGPTPSVTIDPRLNWAIVTPGGGGSVNIVDLGRNSGVTPGDTVGRPPVVIGSLSVTTSTQGVGINTQTHQALLTDPNGGTLSTYSLLDNTVSNVPFRQNGNPVSQPGFVAAAVNPLSNVGIAVNSLAGTAAIVDMQNSNVLQTVTGLTSPQAVAIDAVTNQAFIVNQGSNTVSVVTLGVSGQFRPLQIVESSPTIALVTNPTTPVTLTINGIGFSGSSQVVVDGTPLPPGDVSVVGSLGREIVATIPAAMLTNARNFIAYVQSGGQWSNTTELTLIQPVPVGNTPVGVAVDQHLDQAVVTNNADNTVSILNLLTGTPILTGSTVSVGSNPTGVSVIDRLGLAVVANNGSNNVTVVDEEGINGIFASPTTLPLCGTCFAPAGVGLNSDAATAGIADTDPGNITTPGSGDVSFVSLPASGTSATLGATVTVDQFPVAVAMAPVLLSPPVPGIITTLDFAAVDTASSASSVDLVNVASASIVDRVSPFQLPTGVVFDPVNQDFLVADSVINNVVIVDPTTFIPTSFKVGIGPTSLDYNYQTSTLVTNNAASNTISVVGYVCPPSPNNPPSCAGPQVRDVLGVGGLLQPAAVVIGPNSIAIDLKLNLGVLVDQSNNRVLLVPLPH
jgi:DNA-binding beta-propeller fold protein YncE